MANYNIPPDKSQSLVAVGGHARGAVDDQINPEPVPPLLRRRDLVTMTGISYGLVDKLVRDGVLPVVKVSETARAFYRREDVERVFRIKL